MKISYLLWIIVAGAFFSCTNTERDYLAVHNKAIVADLHSDTAMRMRDGFDFSTRDTTGHMDLPRLKEGGVDLQVFACFVGNDLAPAECRPYVDEMLDSLLAQIGRHPDTIAVCTTAAEAERIIGVGKIAAFLGIENGIAINSDLANLRHFYDRGVRYLTLTHVVSNDWCISSADTAPAFNGLTDFGRDVVKTMNDLGMIIDVSHSSPAAVAEVLKVTTDPVIASHSCVYSICPSDRNLTDDQIKAIAANGGVIGINFYAGYLSPGGRWDQVWDSIFAAHQSEIDSIDTLYHDDRPARRKAMAPFWQELIAEMRKLGMDIGVVVDHIDHIVKLVGPDYVGLGSDFDGVFALPKGLTDCSLVPNITKELVRRGYSNKDINKILGGNFMRVFRQVCDQHGRT
jgi:membrane dipeptidase